MQEFGQCELIETEDNTPCGSYYEVRAQRATLPNAGQVAEIKARIATLQFPPDPGVHLFKCMIYDDDDNYPGTLVGYSGAQPLLDNSGKVWVTFTFDPVLELPAGDYWIGVQRQGTKGHFVDIDISEGDGYWFIDAGADWYNNPPATFPPGGTPWNFTVLICATYIPDAAIYPTSLLKKGFVSAFHCFMSAYILAKTTGHIPLKLPDGTIF